MVFHISYPLVLLVSWILVLFGLVFLGGFCNFPLFPCVALFSWLECRVAALLNPFTGSLLWETCLHCSLPSPGHWSLAVIVYPDICEGKFFVITIVEGVGYQVVKGICTGVQSSTLSTKAHNQENQFLHQHVLWGWFDRPA